MPIYDFNGTTKQEIGKIYDFNGTANSQIGKVYDNNGSANSLIYTGVSPSNPQILVNGVAAQADVTGNIVGQQKGGSWYGFGYTTSQGGSFQIIPASSAKYGSIYFATPFEVTGYSKLCCQIYGKKGYGDAVKVNGWFGFGLTSNPAADPDNASPWAATTWEVQIGDVGEVTYTLNLSGDITGNYCYVGLKTTTAGAYQLYIKNIWLEE